MAEWQRARLIPTTGVGSAREAEVRATSAFLAVLSIVRPLSKALLDPLGAPKGQNATVECFIELPFKTPAKVSRPDGMIRVTHGSRSWTALVEVKTGGSLLEVDQLNTYWDLAREHNFDAVVTISNQFQPAAGLHPTEGLKVRSNSKVKIHHWSWFMVRTVAAVERDHRGVDDPEQAWLLNELLRYLDHTSSGALEFADMGEHWTDLRDAARDGTVSRRDPPVSDLAQRWDQLLRYLSLRLAAETGANVEQVLSRSHRESPQQRNSDLRDTFATEGKLAGILRIPNAVDDIELCADVRAGRISAAVAVGAPMDRGTKARVSWLIRQLGEAPDGLTIEAWQKNGRAPAVSRPLGAVREDAAQLIPTGSGDLVRYRLVLTSEMGRGRRPSGRSPSFVESLERLLFTMYSEVVQPLRAWTAAAPKVAPSVNPTNAPDPAGAPLPVVPVDGRPSLTAGAIPAATPTIHVQPPGGGGIRG